MQCVTAVDGHWLAELGPMFFTVKESTSTRFVSVSVYSIVLCVNIQMCILTSKHIANGTHSLMAPWCPRVTLVCFTFVS